MKIPAGDIFKEVFLISIAAIAVAFFANWVSPKGVALVGEWDTSQGVISAKAKDDAVDHKREITDIEKAESIFRENNSVFIDARSETDYKEGHIPGATSLPVNSFDAHIESFLDVYPLDTPLVTYCSGRMCEDSHVLAQYLIEIGYQNVRVFIDGFPAWKEKGLPVE